MRIVFIYDFFIHTIEFFFCVALCFYICFFANQSYLANKRFRASGLFSKNNVAFIAASLLVFFCFFILLNTPVIVGKSFFFTLQNSFLSYYFKLAILFFTFFYFFSFQSSSFFVFEFFAIVLLSVFGILIILQSNDFTVLYLGIELQTLCLYFLAAYKRNSAYSIEAGVKYFIIGAFSSCVFLYGVSLLYSFTGTTNYESVLFLITDLLFKNCVFILIGFAIILFGFFFKLGVAPLHFWLGDVYEGSSTTVTLFFATAPKIALIGTLFIILQGPFFIIYEDFQFALLFFSLLSIFVGAFFTYYQKRIRKFFAFSSVNHVGFLLVGLSTGSLLGFSAMFFYLFIYIVTSFAIWLIMQCTYNKNKRVTFLIHQVMSSPHNFFYRVSFALLIFSIAGIPPFGGFVSKALLLISVVENYLFFTVIFIIFFSVFSTVYYLKVIKGLFFISSFNAFRVQSSTNSFFFFYKGSSFCIISFSFFVFFISMHPNFLYLCSFIISQALLFMLTKKRSIFCSFVFFAFKNVKGAHKKTKIFKTKICFNRSHNINKKSKSYLFFIKPNRVVSKKKQFSCYIKLQSFCITFFQQFFFFYKATACFFKLKIIFAPHSSKARAWRFQRENKSSILFEEMYFLTMTQKHPFHLVDPSPWPFVVSSALFILTTSAVLYMHNYQYAFFFFITSFIFLIFGISFWWRDVVREGTFEGQHTSIVQLGLRFGIILFIVSEIIFFFAFFWSFFWASLAPVPEIGSVWPPKGIAVLNAWEVPFLNTIILLSSGASVTWTHHAIITGSRNEAIFSLTITVFLAVLFTALQVFEYITSSFTIFDSIYGSTFYIATGFHGFHVFVGTIFLFVCLVRILGYQFTKQHHFGFEAAAWYWHFVDVVWLFLFVSVYWWGN